jgi:hypothetical protein
MYFKQHGAMHGVNSARGFVPPAPITRILCEPCAEIELTPTVFGGQPKGTRGRHWGTGWKWAPHYGGPCDRCGAPC